MILTRPLASYDLPAITRNTVRRAYHVSLLEPYLWMRDTGSWLVPRRARMAAYHVLQLALLLWLLPAVLIEALAQRLRPHGYDEPPRL